MTGMTKHDRLIDADSLFDVLMELEKNEYTPQVFARFICNHEEIFPTIIEADEPLWKRMVMAAKELEKSIPEEVKRKAEAVICETVCIEVEDGE